MCSAACLKLLNPEVFFLLFEIEMTVGKRTETCSTCIDSRSVVTATNRTVRDMLMIEMAVVVTAISERHPKFFELRERTRNYRLLVVITSTSCLHRPDRLCQHCCCVPFSLVHSSLAMAGRKSAARALRRNRHDAHEFFSYEPYNCKIHLELHNEQSDLQVYFCFHPFYDAVSPRTLPGTWLVIRDL